MINLRSAKRVATLVVLSGFLLTVTKASGNPTLYALSQAGWSGGGEVSGYFAGEDLNHDGYINLADGEVSSYQITLSGNSVFPDFTHTLGNLQFFRYAVGSTGFRPSFPLFSVGSGLIYDADDHVIGLPDLSVAIVTSQDARVTAVPEPATPCIIALGLVSMAAALRRRPRNPSNARVPRRVRA